jgi:plasmid stabilization system protein ParE
MKKKYTLTVHPDAEIDIESSFQWGCRRWGRKKAKSWMRELRRVILSRLTLTPLSGSIAPESEELGIPIRQLVFGRYRVLYLVEKKTVTVLHMRGSYYKVRIIRIEIQLWSNPQKHKNSAISASNGWS